MSGGPSGTGPEERGARTTVDLSLPDLSSHVLGRTRGPVTLDTAAANHWATLALLRQCQRTVDIVSRGLDAAIYDRPDVLAALRALVVGTRRARVRVLVRDTSRAIAHGHRLVHLARQLSTFVQIRKLGLQHRDFNSSLLVADATGTIVRKLADRFEGEVSFTDPVAARDLTRLFDDMWAAGLEDPDLRSLHI